MAFSCDVCGKTYTTKGALHRHKETVHSKRSFGCSVCSKAFTRRYKLKAHMRSHGNQGNDSGLEVAIGFLPESPQPNPSVDLKVGRTLTRKTVEIYGAMDSFDDSALGWEPDNSSDSPTNGVRTEPEHKQTVSIATEEQGNKSRQIGDTLGQFPQASESQTVLAMNKTATKERAGKTEDTQHSHRFKCPVCLKSLSSPKSLTRHVQEIHSEKAYKCEKCEKMFSRTLDFIQHMESHKRWEGSADEDERNPAKKRKYEEEAVERTKRSRRSGPTIYERDGQAYIGQMADDTYPGPLELEEEFEERTCELPERSEFHDVFTTNWDTIQSRLLGTKGKGEFVVNFRLAPDSNLSELAEGLCPFDEESVEYRVNLTVGSIQRNTRTSEVTYHYCTDARLFRNPIVIDSQPAFEGFLHLLGGLDLLDLTRNRNSDRDVVNELLTNVTFLVTTQKQISTKYLPTKVDLPSYVKRNRSVIGLAGNKNGIFTDRLSFFRCLAIHTRWRSGGRGCQGIERSAKALFEQYLKHLPVIGSRFRGVELSELPLLERIFQTNIEVYSLQQCAEDPTSVSAILVQRSAYHFAEEDTMYLNLFGEHFSYISDWAEYSRKVQYCDLTCD